MERLTVKRKDGRWAIANNDGASPMVQMEKIPIAINRLAAYEDTSLMPEEITALMPPPNPPLPLEELREMDGEPVWVVSLDGQNVSCWMLVDADYKLCRGAFGGIAVFENNGKTWHAYRRKPEELQEMKEASRTKYVCAVTRAPCCWCNPGPCSSRKPEEGQV